jgi:hypothetical protein
MLKAIATVACGLLFILPAPARAVEKLGLVIGNWAYTGQVPQLTNPGHDADLVSAALRDAGFTVTTLKNQNNDQILDAVKSYSTRLGETPGQVIGFFYYSGHGIARPNEGGDYLLPVNVTELDSKETWHQSVSLDDILGEFAKTSPNATHFVVFDACRSVLRLPYKSTNKGFDAVEPQNGIFLAFSTSPHHTASDVGDEAGPYATSLAAAIRTPGLDHLALFQRAKQATYNKTAASDDPQHPWENDGLIPLVYINPPLAPKLPQPMPESASTAAVDLAPKPQLKKPVRVCVVFGIYDGNDVSHRLFDNTIAKEDAVAGKQLIAFRIDSGDFSTDDNNIYIVHRDEVYWNSGKMKDISNIQYASSRDGFVVSTFAKDSIFVTDDAWVTRVYDKCKMDITKDQGKQYSVTLQQPLPIGNYAMVLTEGQRDKEVIEVHDFTVIK